jgi:hypothetical protein
MFGSTILDAAIGLITVFLLFSLIVTAVQEGIASFLDLRARQLFVGIQELLDDAGSTPEKSLAKKLYDHSLVASLSKGNTLPSYLPSRTFVIALLDTLVPATATTGATLDGLRQAISNLPQARARQALLALLGEAQGDVEKFKTLLETWFNNVMDRVSGWYKRQAQAIVVLLATVLVITLNVNSFQLGKAFLRDPSLRESLVTEAGKLISGTTPATAATGQQQTPAELQSLITLIDVLNLPIGWNSVDVTLPASVNDLLVRCGRAAGWFTTIFAISLGAPFWFDILKSVMNIRGTGKAPKSKNVAVPAKNS